LWRMNASVRNLKIYGTGTVLMQIAIYFFLAAFTLAHRAFAAALILAIPAAEILRLGRPLPGVSCVLLLALSQRAR
jgi:hypothetical protein